MRGWGRQNTEIGIKYHRKRKEGRLPVKADLAEQAGYCGSLRAAPIQNRGIMAAAAQGMGAADVRKLGYIVEIVGPFVGAAYRAAVVVSQDAHSRSHPILHDALQGSLMFGRRLFQIANVSGGRLIAGGNPLTL